MDKHEFEQALRYFTGTEKWTRYNPLFPNHVLTDGALFVASEAGAFWLMDVIASYAGDKRVKGEWMQAWKLTVNPDQSWVIICEDGNKNELLRQAGDYTDFPLAEFEIWAIKDEPPYTVILLPSEY